MPVFKTFLKLLWRKAPVASIYLVVFFAITIAMTLSGGAEKMYQQTSLNVCIFDEDDTPESRALCDLIAENNKIVPLEQDRDILLDALYYERVSFVLTIREGYAERLASGSTEGLFESQHLHTSYSAVMMEQFLNEYARTASAYLAGGMPLPDAVAAAGETLSAETTVEIAVFEENGEAPLSKDLGSYFRYLPYIFISVIMNALCPVLLAVSRKDIRYRTSCSGIRSGVFTAQIFAGSAVFILLIWLLFVAAGIWIGGGMYHGAAWIAVLNSLIFALFSAALTVLAAGFDPGPNMINAITQVSSLGMSFLCGVFVEQSMLGDGVLAAGRFLPAYWYIRVNQMLDGTTAFDAADIAASLGIEAGFAAVTALLAVLVRRVRSNEGILRRPAAGSAGAASAGV